MCTISYVPIANKMVFTFNRDEHPNRKAPVYLSRKVLAQKNIYYPLDPKASGTWFVADDKGNIALLFNGGLEKHNKQNNYERSRGVLLLELFSEENLVETFMKTNLLFMEPFSILLYEKKTLVRLVWDGTTKMKFLLDSREKHIFSSATIYSKEIQMARENWLNTYTAETDINEKNIFDFHNSYNSKDKENGLVIDRNNALKTLSISQAIIENDSVVLQHYDLEKNKFFTENIPYDFSQHCLQTT